MKRHGLRPTSPSCRTSYSAETGIAVPAFGKWRVGSAQTLT
jgi:hypothetical protein